MALQSTQVGTSKPLHGFLQSLCLNVRRSKMKIIATLLFMVLTINAYASEKCNTVVHGYEAQDIMYVVCKDLSHLTNKKASQLIISIFNQYKGPADEILVYFVASKGSVGKINPEGNELVGLYYTHSRELEIWPNSKNKKRVVKIKWD